MQVQLDQPGDSRLGASPLYIDVWIEHGPIRFFFVLIHSRINSGSLSTRSSKHFSSNCFLVMFPHLELGRFLLVDQQHHHRTAKSRRGSHRRQGQRRRGLINLTASCSRASWLFFFPAFTRNFDSDLAFGFCTHRAILPLGKDFRACLRFYIFINIFRQFFFFLLSLLLLIFCLCLLPACPSVTHACQHLLHKVKCIIGKERKKKKGR